MNKKTIIIILTILVLPILAYWGISYSKESKLENYTGNKPQVIKFSSTMCLECKQVEKIFKEILPKYQDKIEYTSVIVDSGKDMNHALIKKHKIQLVPTVLMLNSEGKECERIEGAASKDKYEKAIEGLK